MVASIAPMSKGIETYYTELAREDYYLEGGEPPGKWLGTAAEKLGLTGEVQKEDLSKLLAGFGRKNNKLVRNAGSENHQVGWDMTFSAPKDVSIIWGIGSEAQRTAIEEAHSKAVEVAIEYLQREAMWSRTGKAGVNWKSAEAVVGTFLHGTSRDVDPNLHTHALFANVGLREDGKTGTIVSKKLYEHKMVAGALYRAALAENLTQELGFELEQTKDWFQIKGFSKACREFFSKRSEAIKEAAGPDASQIEKDRANLTTRQVKGHVARNELHPIWQDQADEFGLTQEYVDSLFSLERAQQSREKQNCHTKAKEACKEALAELTEEEGYFSKTGFLRKAIGKLQTGELDVPTILEECEKALDANEVKGIGKNTQQTKFFATEKQLETENELVKVAEKMSKEIGKPITKTDVKKIIEGSSTHKLIKKAEAFINNRIPELLRFKASGHDYTNLNGLQKAALYQITSEMGSIKTVAGRAGTGKTTMLAAAREAWESKGYHVVGCSVSGMAAQELAKGAGITSETVDMRLLQLEKSAWRTLKMEARQLLRAFIKKNRLKLDQFKLTKKSVLVIDEASMLSSKQLMKLLDHAKSAKAKVVLVGDVRQLPSLSAGGGFARLFKQTNGIELTETIRQKTDWLKEAVNLFAEGDTRGAITKFAESKRLAFGKDQEQVRENLLKDWNKNRTSDLSQTVILAPTNNDVDSINQAAQDIRRRNGELEKNNFTVGETKYFTGDRIAFHANNRELGVWNGDRGTIKAIAAPFTPFSVRFVVELDRGETVIFCPRDLKTKFVAAEDAMSLGYATTIHKSQGMTVDKSFLMFDGKASQELAYVGLTRSRFDSSIHCQTKHVEEDVVQYEEAQKDLERQASRSQGKQMATDVKEKLHEEQQKEAERQRAQQHSHSHNL